MSLERLFRNYSGIQSLPKDEGLIDRFVRYAVGRFNYSNSGDKALEILLDLGPERCANYVVGALQNPKQVNYATKYLLTVGLTKDVSAGLVGALGDDTIINSEQVRDTAVRLLKLLSPINDTYRFLAVALSNPKQRRYAKDVLVHYGHNIYSTGYVLAAVEDQDPDTSNAAKEILISPSYGKKAAKLIVVHASKNKNFVPIALHLISQIQLDSYAIRNIIDLLEDETKSNIVKFILMSVNGNIVTRELMRALDDPIKKPLIEEILQYREPLRANQLV